MEDSRGCRRKNMKAHNDLIRWFEDLSSQDVPLVGGKNASLGEMIGRLSSKGIRVSEGFAVTSSAYWRFLEANDLKESLKRELKKIKRDEKTLSQVGKTVRQFFLKGEIPEEIKKALRETYRELGLREKNKISASPFGRAPRRRTCRRRASRASRRPS